jgi:hypothetical protein
MNFHLESVTIFIVFPFPKKITFSETILKLFQNTQGKNIHYLWLWNSLKDLKVEIL